MKASQMITVRSKEITLQLAMFLLFMLVRHEQWIKTAILQQDIYYHISHILYTLPIIY